jgi:hypothetical protein
MEAPPRLMNFKKESTFPEIYFYAIILKGHLTAAGDINFFA